MKKWLSVLLCVVFLFCLNIKGTFCFCDEKVVFNYHGKEFNYTLLDNVKTNNVFSCNAELKKFNRFGSKQERQKLLSKLLALGFDCEVCVNYLFPNINKTITRVEKAINTKAKDAKISIDYGSEKVFNIESESCGVNVDKFKLYNLICKQYLANKALVFNVPTIVLQPDVFKADLQKHCFLRGDFSTDISSSSADRKHNIKNAIHSLNGVEILPGQQFSFNGVVGRRSVENGYRQAKIIVNNEFVEGLGGGVCQVSSTLYNSALLAGLKIKEANKHSKPVAYIKRGFDAMVNFGSSDLKFYNNTNEKLTIVANFSTSRIRIRIFGESLHGYSYKLSNDVVNTTQPTEEIVYDFKQEYGEKVQFDDEWFYLKKASVGYEVKSYREIYKDGKLTSKELLRYDKFPVQNAVKVYGTKKRTENCAFLLLTPFTCTSYV